VEFTADQLAIDPPLRFGRDMAAARIAAACDDARRRLERDLHDGAQQRLVALSLRLQLIAGRLVPGSEAETLLGGAREELAAALQELRDLACGLHPAVLTNHGLPVALESLAARAAVPVALEVALSGRLAAEAEVAAYYVVCEALTNIAKYARAGRARVTVSEGAGQLLVEVEDDGAGGADPSRGSGLRGLADRVGALGGRLAIREAHGGGTLVRAQIPLPA
jgi:signal transduction histidine kinase